MPAAGVCTGGEAAGEGVLIGRTSQTRGNEKSLSRRDRRGSSIQQYVGRVQFPSPGTGRAAPTECSLSEEGRQPQQAQHCSVVIQAAVLRKGACMKEASAVIGRIVSHLRSSHTYGRRTAFRDRNLRADIVTFLNETSRRGCGWRAYGVTVAAPRSALGAGRSIWLSLSGLRVASEES